MLCKKDSNGRKINVAKSRTSKKYCKECGLRIRGPLHDEGTHHRVHKNKVD